MSVPTDIGRPHPLHARALERHTARVLELTSAGDLDAAVAALKDIRSVAGELRDAKTQRANRTVTNRKTTT